MHVPVGRWACFVVVVVVLFFLGGGGGCFVLNMIEMTIGKFERNT